MAMSRKKKLLIGIPTALVLLAAYLLLWPVGIDPAVWEPPPAPALSGPFEPNEQLAQAQLVPVGGFGPEAIAVDAQGRLHTGLADGRIVRVDPAGGEPVTVANTGGRPLGLKFDKEGRLYVADADKGLVAVETDGAVTTLLAEVDGVPIGFANALDIADDGTVYLSDSSVKFGLSNMMLDVLEHRPNGRLIAYDPAAETARVVLGELYFPNGIAVSPDQFFVLVVETTKYRVLRYWLSGPARGVKDEEFLTNLPGIPDGISSNGSGVYWLTLYAPRNATLDGTLPKPFLRKLLARLPGFLQPGPARYGFVLGVNRGGQVVANLQDPAGAFAPISFALEVGGALYLGSTEGTNLARVPLAGAMVSDRQN